jgi:asparagine synthase (glutamine-hydrolysing)
MSGFAGIVRLGGTQERTADDAQRVKKMAAAIAFRGPDAQTAWSQDDAHFCFSFLKTGPAPQTQNQPRSLDGKVWLLGDVRLDGREEAIGQLRQQGEKLNSGCTDEEFVLRAFQSEGEGAITAFDGDFSFVLWNGEEKKLFGFRDLTGSKPFFYALADGAISFSNTLEALRCAPGFTGAFDEYFIGDYLLAGWCLDQERTIYKEIRRLPPGHALQFSEQGLKVRRTSQLPIEDLLQYKREEEYIEQYRDLLDRAVNDRLPDGPCVVFMSGGLDSTAVAAVAARIAKSSRSNARIAAQTVDYKPLFDDQEGEEARRVAAFLNIPFELLHGGACMPFAACGAPGIPSPEPKHEPFQAFHVESYRKAVVGGRVALSGDGGDDILLGQAWPYLRSLLDIGKWGAAAGAVSRHIWNTRSLPALGLGIRSALQKRLGSGPEPEPFPPWITDSFAARLNLRERFAELQRKPVSDHPTHPWAYAMLSGSFWPNVLEGEDAAWSGVAMETRAPLLDRRLVRFLLRLPAMPWCMNKQLVRRAMKNLLPKETVERAKAPLPYDPLELHVSQGKWNPLPLQNLSSFLREVVDPMRLQNSLHSRDTEHLYMNLRPISLDAWLKGVEMKGGIQ